VLRSKPKTTYERVYYMLVNELWCDPLLVNLAATFVGDLGLRHEDYQTLADAIEDEFSIPFELEAARDCPTVGHLVRWIDGR
jgi:acyl carrier protein